MQDRILRETIERERYADYRKQTYLGRTMLLALHGSQPHLFTALEEELSLAVFQTAFDPAAVEQRLAGIQQLARQRRDAVLRDARMLARVASYSETDEDQEYVAEQGDVFARRLAERATQKAE